MDDYGMLINPNTLRLERMLPGPIERVWAFLTESTKRAAWIAAGDMDLRIGGRVQLIFDHDRLSPEKEAVPEKYQDNCAATMDGTITRIDAPRLLAYTWGEDDGSDSEVCFELTEVGDEVKLVLTHERLVGHDQIVGVSAGWHAHIAILIDVLKGDTPRPLLVDPYAPGGRV